VIDASLAPLPLRGPLSARRPNSLAQLSSCDRLPVERVADQLDEGQQARVDLRVVLDRVEDRDGVADHEPTEASGDVRVTRAELRDEVSTARLCLCEQR
jgi:hypothetical protein